MILIPIYGATPISLPFLRLKMVVHGKQEGSRPPVSLFIALKKCQMSL